GLRPAAAPLAAARRRLRRHPTGYAWPVAAAAAAHIAVGRPRGGGPGRAIAELFADRARGLRGAEPAAARPRSPAPVAPGVRSGAARAAAAGVRRRGASARGLIPVSPTPF